VVRTEPAGELTLKGLRHPVSAYRVIGRRHHDPRRAAERAPGAVLVGRHDQLRHLESALGDAREGVGRVVLLAGEPGIGKTRLAEELAHRASATHTGVAWGRCSDQEGAPAFWPWMQVIAELVRERGKSRVRAALEPSAAVIAQIVPEVGALTEGVPPPSALEPAAARFRLYDSVTVFLRRLAGDRPVVILLEDLHWADVASLQLLAHVAAQISDAAIMVLATYRDVDPLVGPPLSDTLAELARRPVTTRLSLAGLTPADVARYITVATGVQPSAAVVNSVHDRTEGNPFFLGELVRLLGSPGEGSEPASTWTTAVPLGVRDVIRHRVSRLPAATANLLTQAAVLGREVDIELLSRVAGVTPSATLDALEPAVDARLLIGTSQAGARYRFSHALVNQSLYEEIGGVRRARLHARVAEALEELYSRDDEAHLTELSHHFFLGVPASDPARAFGYALRAAEWAQGRLAYEQAEEELRRALTLIPRMPAGERIARELALHMRLTLLLTTTQGYGADAVLSSLLRARQLAVESGDNGALAVCLWALCAFHTTRGEYETSRVFAEEARATGERADSDILLMAGAWGLGMIAFCTGQLKEARDAYRRAIALAHALDDPSLAERFGQDPCTNSRVFLGLVEWLLGATEEAERLIAEAIDLATAGGNKLSLANATLFDAMLGVFGGDAERARRSAEKTIALCEEEGFGLFQKAATVLHGWAIARQGDPAAGGVEIATGATLLLEIGTPMLHHFHLGLRADAFRMEGKPQQGLAALDEAFQLVEQAGGLFWEAELHRLRAEMLLALLPDRRHEAEAELASALAVARAQGAKSLEERVTMSSAGRLLHGGIGEPEHAGRR
jgi:predicted ATPase